MQRFTQLFNELDSTTRTSGKLEALRRYFGQAPARDAAWALALLSGGKLIRSISSRRLREWASLETGYPAWLVGECYDAVGDLSETLALLLPEGAREPAQPLHRLVEDRVLPLPRLDEEGQRSLVRQAWSELSARQRFLYHKMILGNMRVGVAAQLVVRALSEVAGTDSSVMAHRLTGGWKPSEEAFQRLMQADAGEGEPARPYPFFLAYPLQKPLEDLGSVSDWQVEWKWDGIRAQVIHREQGAGNGEQELGSRCEASEFREKRTEQSEETFGSEMEHNNADLSPVPRSLDPIRSFVLIWSRGDELITEGFPEIAEVACTLPLGTVLDGEILAWEDERPLPFALLQRRINRKREEPRLWDEVPVIFMAYDILERGGQDVRSRPLNERRRMLAELGDTLSHLRHFRLSPSLSAESWIDVQARQEKARDLGAEGLMIKRLESAYGVGRQTGDWWKWKVDPYTIDAVLIYAQLGNGRRANLFTDYTFGLWNEGDLVPVAKAYSGLTAEEIHQVDAFVRRNTIDRHGPLRVVKPELVFELAFENIQESTRHKSGLAVRFPRMARWRRDKKAAEADTLDALRSLFKEKSANRQDAEMKQMEG